MDSGFLLENLRGVIWVLEEVLAVIFPLRKCNGFVRQSSGL